MKSRPILFKGEMVNAILEGRKTQTRRVVKPQPHECDHYSWPERKTRWKSDENGWYCAVCGNGVKLDFQKRTGVSSIVCPFGKVGDQLWVRENYFFDSIFNHLKPSEVSKGESVGYLATGMIHTAKGKAIITNGKVRPSIFMPRWASRITLEITDIRVERLNDISEDDARAEGVKWEVIPDRSGVAILKECRNNFQKLWKSINGSDSWNENPWVWVIEFKKLEK